MRKTLTAVCNSGSIRRQYAAPGYALMYTVVLRAVIIPAQFFSRN